MRTLINSILKTTQQEIYFLHCDSWHFENSNPNLKIINCGVQEPNMINITIGLLLKGKTVIVYGIAGFVLEKCVEQFRLYFSNPKGKFIFLEAGAHHEYPAELGIGHSFGNNNIDFLLKYLNIFKIWDFYGYDHDKVVQTFNRILNSKDNCNIILLGKDM